jgi:hypothetical protein
MAAAEFHWGPHFLRQNIPLAISPRRVNRPDNRRDGCVANRYHDNAVRKTQKAVPPGVTQPDGHLRISYVLLNFSDHRSSMSLPVLVRHLRS